MTSTNTNLAGPNPIFLNVILAIIAFILIIYLRNIYVTIISVVIVVGVYFVFDTKALFKVNEDPATPYIESEELAETGNSAENDGSEPVIRAVQEEELAVKVGCSEYYLTDPNIIQIKEYTDFLTADNQQNAKDPSKTFILMKSIDCGEAVISGGVYPEFNASLNGNCFSIMNFTISNSASNKDNAGFFTAIKANGSEVNIKNVTFEDFNFIINGDLKRFGVFGYVDGNNGGVVFENVSVHLNRPSLVTINSGEKYFLFGTLMGFAQSCKLLDCNIILSHRFDIYISSNNLKTLSFGGMCGGMRKSSIMACSVNLIGSSIVSNIINGSYNIGLLVGSSWSPDSNTAYLNLLNNTIILKDASLKTNFNLNNYGYLVGGVFAPYQPVAKNNTISDFLKEDYFGNTNKLSNGNFKVDENNNMNMLGSLDPSEISIVDQIYGLSFSDSNSDANAGANNEDVYWKKVYYIYHEGDTSNMNCRKYKVFNFWKNTELETYCEDEGNCNTNLYGVCDSGKYRRGWAQFADAVTIDCQQTGKTTYTLTSDITLRDTFTPIILDDGITFDGGEYTINVGVCNGLFKFVKKDYMINVTIKNVNVNVTNVINNTAGAIIGTSQVLPNQYAKYNIILMNCHSKGGRITGYAGGIVGSRFCANSESTGKIIYCSNECPITGPSSGGICGPNACSYGGKLEVIGCWNTGNMADNRSHGGIIGPSSGSDSKNSHLLVFNCYNQGNLGNDSGGIVAKSNITGDRLMVLNCYSYCQFQIPDQDGLTYGGIVASLSGSTDTIVPCIIYCDVYLTHPSASWNTETLLDDFICKTGFLKFKDSNGKYIAGINSAARYTGDMKNDINYHSKYFNLSKLNTLIDTLPYEFLSPMWDTNYLGIPSPRFEDL